MTISNKKMLQHLRAMLLLLPLLFVPLYAEALRQGTVRGIRLCVTTIIPSVFPFMILSSLILHYSVAESLGFLSGGFRRLFRIGEGGFCAFLCGFLCGFPIGAKCAAEAYEAKRITKEECERLIAFCSNASPAFVIAGVGAMRKSIYDGIILYLLMLLCSVTVGIFLRRKKAPSMGGAIMIRKSLSFTKCVENAGLQTLFVCSYILLFSSVIGVLKAAFANNTLLLSIVLPFLEIGSACEALATIHLSKKLSMAFTAFAVSFGGLSVHLQTATILRESSVCMNTYYVAKLIQGLLAFLLALLIC